MHHTATNAFDKIIEKKVQHTTDKRDWLSSNNNIENCFSHLCGRPRRLINVYARMATTAAGRERAVIINQFVRIRIDCIYEYFDWNGRKDVRCISLRLRLQSLRHTDTVHVFGGVFFVIVSDVHCNRYVRATAQTKTTTTTKRETNPMWMTLWYTQVHSAESQTKFFCSRFGTIFFVVRPPS